ncbi:hypothetical protein QOZ80_2AG0137250 [Eleusine coracana subsp. coracana]|nr:hypothetical protein QOZ80_2AG0137250 [Eleusine coracana subsp. coracana]
MPSPRKKSNPTLPSDLPEEVIADILSRLPGKYVLRFRAVCKAWRRITTDPHFLAAHMRRRPLELVLCTLLEQRPLSGDQVGSSRDLAFDSIPVTAADPADQRHLIRYPGYYTATPAGLTNFGSGNLPITSCAGVFLFRLDTRPVPKEDCFWEDDDEEDDSEDTDTSSDEDYDLYSEEDGDAYGDEDYHSQALSLLGLVSGEQQYSYLLNSYLARRPGRVS